MTGKKELAKPTSVGFLGKNIIINVKNSKGTLNMSYI